MLSEEAAQCKSPFMWDVRNRANPDGQQAGGARRGGGWGVTVSWVWAFSGVTNILELEVMVTPHCECAKCHGIVHSEMADFTLCDFHLNFKKGKELRIDSIEMGFILHEITQKGIRTILKGIGRTTSLKLRGA